MKSKNGNRKRKSISKSLITHYQNPNTICAIILASLSNPNPNSKSIIQKCLNKLNLSLLSNSPTHQTLPIPILSLLPLLLHSKHHKIACRCAEIIGAASLLSLETNQQLASDSEIIKTLISVLAVTTSNREVLIAVTNSVLDLSSTSIGQQRLLQFSALETLM